tara:strand:+ start:303 stop:953 length:651 start_codon:yes stop_codon:yes gene_type:complete
VDWNPSLGTEWEKSVLQKAIADLQAALRPAQPQELMVAVNKILTHGAAFNIKMPSEKDLVEAYKGLADLPSDLLELAVTRLLRHWKYHSMPMPSEVTAHVSDELLERNVALQKAIVAVRGCKEEVKIDTSGPVPRKKFEHWKGQLARSKEVRNNAKPIKGEFTDITDLIKNSLRPDKDSVSSVSPQAEEDNASKEKSSRSTKEKSSRSTKETSTTE